MIRTFDYIPRLDERNRAYRVQVRQVPGVVGPTTYPRYWTPGYPVLNQHAEGACVGHGVVGEAMASPVRVRVGQQDAFDVYHRALQIDEFEGERDEGTSVRAGMLVGRERGWWSGFRWALNLAELRAALEEGPVVVGVEWREDSYEAPDGILRTTGRAVGGHCVLLNGYTPRHRKIGGPAYRIRNSWGPEFGSNGLAYIAVDDLDSILFQAGGEAAVPVERAA